MPTEVLYRESKVTCLMHVSKEILKVGEHSLFEYLIYYNIRY